jgi:hypothetical protein
VSKDKNVLNDKLMKYGDGNIENEWYPRPADRHIAPLTATIEVIGIGWTRAAQSRPPRRPSSFGLAPARPNAYS